MRVTTFTETMRGWIGPTVPPVGSEQESPAGELLLSDLHLRLPHPGTRDAGFAGGVLSGVVSAPGFTGRVNGGRAEILIREGGCRVMRYELLAESTSGQRVHVAGMKYLRGGRLRLWRDTTTLFVEVRGLGAPGSVASGTARVLVRDLVPQVLSLRGSRAGFVCRFLRLALR